MQKLLPSRQHFLPLRTKCVRDLSLPALESLQFHAFIFNFVRPSETTTKKHLPASPVLAASIETFKQAGSSGAKFRRNNL
ncbi:hypothetical protein ANHS_1443 [Ligilactobacillus ruminis ATCC 25644]|nr:hypothetical protein ANHS_1443 [Ligilactobacillus ruminis ATCC 25644]